MNLLDSLETFFKNQGVDKQYWLAYSGGLDSHVLLHACSVLQSKLHLRLHVIHVNHNLSQNAKHWENHCQKICAAYGMVLHLIQLQLEINTGDSLEEVARGERYRAFKKYLNVDDVLLTAHHQDDQAETVILQLCRGAGIAGLSAMPVLKKFAHSWHARPLLHFPRKALQDYAITNRLNWIDDESNSSLNLRRNFVRHEILPILQKQLPTVTASIARSAKHCAESQALLHDLASELLESVIGSKPNTLSIRKLLELSDAKQSLILRTWIKQHGHVLPSTKKIQTIKDNVFNAAKDRFPCVQFSNTELRRYQDDLYLMPSLPAPVDPQRIYAWNLQHDLYLPQLGILQCKKEKGGVKKLNHVEVRFRNGGEAIYLHGQHRRLKNYFQYWKIPMWQRPFVPLIFCEEELICVPHYFIDERFQTKQDEEGLRFSLRGEGALLSGLNSD